MIGFQTATLYSRQTSGQTDAYGIEVFTETAQTVTGCSLQPAEGKELLGMQDLVTNRYLLFAPAGTSFDAVDRVEFNGQSFEVDGSPNEWCDFMGRPHHTIVNLRQVTG